MDKEKFGIWLNEKRTQKGMTQEELANELNYTKQAVSKWELGKGMPHNDVIRHIEELFGPIPDDFKELQWLDGFKKLEEYTCRREYEEVFTELAEGTECDPAFACSIKKALHETLWVLLFIYFDRKKERMNDKPFDNFFFNDWTGFLRAFPILFDDYDERLLEKKESGHKYKAKSVLKRKLEVLETYIEKVIESTPSYSTPGNTDTKGYTRDLTSLGAAGNLKTFIPDTDTSWKSSFLAAVYNLYERISAADYVISGVEEELREMVDELKGGKEAATRE